VLYDTVAAWKKSLAHNDFVDVSAVNVSWTSVTIIVSQPSAYGACHSSFAIEI
jgi:hypothetical protein